MNKFDYIKKYNIQKKINNLAKKYKNKKVVLYGAGKFAEYLFNNYDFSKLNIIAIADKKYENCENQFFNNIPGIPPSKINDLNISLVLLLNLQKNPLITQLYTSYICANPKTDLEWILKQNICDYIENKIKYGFPKINKNEKYIFTFWEPKENIPAYIQLCINTWKKFLPEYKIVVLDYSNLDEWLGFAYFDDYLYKRFSLAKQADAIRVALLHKYGGIWLDADTIITSTSVKNIFEKKSDVVMIGKHIAFINARKKARFLKLWFKQIKRNLFFHKFYENYEKYMQYFFSTKNIAKLNNWDFFSNSIVNPLSEKFKQNELLCISRTDSCALPEINYYQNDTNHLENYINFYFKNDFSDYVFNNTKGIILLHNSWTLKEYKTMSKEEFLQQNNTLAKVLLKLTGENNDNQ